MTVGDEHDLTLVSEFGTEHNITKRGENDTIRYGTVRDGRYGNDCRPQTPPPPERDKSAIPEVSWRPVTKRAKSTQAFAANRQRDCRRPPTVSVKFDTSCFRGKNPTATWVAAYSISASAAESLEGRLRPNSLACPRTVPVDDWSREALESRADFSRIWSICLRRGRYSPPLQNSSCWTACCFCTGVQDPPTTVAPR